MREIFPACCASTADACSKDDSEHKNAKIDFGLVDRCSRTVFDF